jgi:methylated-DNA-[protein]-cysteine S-methyltransferase
MGRRWPDATEAGPSAEVERVIAKIRRLLESGKADFSEVRLNLSQIPEFNLRVYQVTRGIPAGQVLTYGEIARRLGDPALARAVGPAMGQNPFPLVIPCHRVVAAGGRPGGFSGGMGPETKLRLLDIEGAVLGDQPSLFGRTDEEP